MVSEYQWINSSQENQIYGKDERRAIRIHAMKRPAARRKRAGNWGKKNKRQYNVIRYSTGQTAPTDAAVSISRYESPPGSLISHPDHADHVGIAAEFNKCVLAPLGNYYTAPTGPIPLHGFERLISDTGLNIVDLEELTSISDGRSASALFSQDSLLLKNLIARCRNSFLVHIPARYGQAPCLDYALQCLATKAKRRLSPSRQCSAYDEIYLYGKAIQSLQAAIDDRDGWADPDVLCAIEVVSMCEILNEQSHPSAWRSHILGAYRLIKARGPENFKTEFEKSLLSAAIVPALCESFVILHPLCFEEPAWQSVFRSLIIPEDNFSLRTNGNSVQDEEIDRLISRCQEMLAELQVWQYNYDFLCASNKVPNGASLADMRSEVLYSGLMVQIVIRRLWGALSKTDRIHLEKEAISLSKQSEQVRLQCATASKYADFRIRQKTKIVKSILNTSRLWLNDDSKTKDNQDTKQEEGLHNKPVQRTINLGIFTLWLQALN
ncbi:hypothetical protein BX600DRAFT_499051 [Xylariales sp. PMI_506]|nr:hypothetical protein BX600DRAFT_499051 [Xylariales sp. PMI_506]